MNVSACLDIMKILTETASPVIQRVQHALADQQRSVLHAV